jgi:hypothetical protein
MATRYVAPFEIQPIAKFTRSELERRERDYGFEYLKSDKSGWDDNGNWKNYKGPLRCWVRICSNGVGEDGKEGFIMHGVNGFYKDYGFDPLTKAKTETVLGFTPDGKEHKIDGEYDIKAGVISKHVPPPGVVSIDATMEKEMYRSVSIKWKCFSKDHLNYMAPYFMSPGVTMFIEWGWNHFNPECLLNLTNFGSPSKMKISMDDKTPGPSGDPDDPRLDKGTGLIGLYTDPLEQQTWVEKGQGLYELTCGIITSFEYSLQADGSYDCTTELKSNSFIYSGVQTRSNATAATSKSDSNGNKKPEPVKSLQDWVNNSFKNLPKTVLTNINTGQPLFDGWKGPETRVFIPRNLNTSRDSRTDVLSVSNYSFDARASEEFWISMGLFIDIINKFCESTTSNGSTFNRIDIQSSWIGGHKNLITTDAKVLLIPNSEAPNISPDSQDRGKSSLYKNPSNLTEEPSPSSVKNQADETLKALFNTVVRQDLDDVVNYFQHKYGGKTQTEFPAIDKKYYSGKLENLYIHKDLVIDAVSKSETVTDILNFVLNKMSEAVNKFWRFNIIQYGPSNSLLTIIDSDTINVERIQELASDNKPYLYFFKNRAAKNTIQSFNFSVKLSDKVALTVMNNNKNDDKTTVPIKNPFGFVTRDRFYKKTSDASYLTPKDREVLEQKKQNVEKERDRLKGQSAMLEKEKDVTEGAYIFGEVDTDPTTGKMKTYIRKLALVNKDILTLMVNDKDLGNTSVNNIPQPGIKAEITLLGIAGLKTFHIFGIDNLPMPYDKDILFQVENVKHSLQSSGMWTTTITAGLRPIRGLNFKS